MSDHGQPNAAPIPLPQLDAAARAAQALRERVESSLRALGITDLRFDRAGRMLYATDASIYQMDPVGVVVPADLQQELLNLNAALQNGGISTGVKPEEGQ